MFFLWGEYNEDREVGIVVDQCATCGRLSRFAVTHHKKVSHLYLIPLGTGTLAGVSRQCQSCGETTPARERQYARCVPRSSAKTMSIEALLEQTNPAVAADVRNRQQLAKSAASARPGAVDANGVDPRVRLALVQLCELRITEPANFELPLQLTT